MRWSSMLMRIMSSFRVAVRRRTAVTRTWTKGWEQDRCARARPTKRFPKRRLTLRSITEHGPPGRTGKTDHHRPSRVEEHRTSDHEISS